jgi:hypothetical protein
MELYLTQQELKILLGWGAHWAFCEGLSEDERNLFNLLLSGVPKEYRESCNYHFYDEWQS